MRIVTYFTFFMLFLFMLLSGCATRVAKPIDEKIEDIPSAQDVLRNIDSYIGQRVRWGGVIANVVNEKDATVVEIVSRPLDKQGRPVDTDQTSGRFLARIEGFLEPVVYAKGRELTIVGTISQKSTRMIDQYEYVYPEVVVDRHKLWQPIELRPDYYYDPYWYGPWRPWYRGMPYYYPWWYY